MTMTMASYGSLLPILERALLDLDDACVTIDAAVDVITDGFTVQVIEGHIWRLKAMKAGLEECVEYIRKNYETKNAEQAQQKQWGECVYEYQYPQKGHKTA